MLTLTNTARGEQPNFVIILADDLGYSDLGCYGNKENRTPHIDRMANEGLRLTDFHANAANCSPTRAALLTGRYQQRMGIEGALGEGGRGLPQSEVTIAERLREKGYATALMGKWHLGYAPENGPHHQGFETFVGHLHGATDYISHVDKYGRMDWWHNECAVREEGYNTSLITKHSLKFIEQHREQPFLLVVSHSAIHFPWMVPEDKPHRQAGKRYEGASGKLGPHLNEPIKPVVRRMIEELDSSVGEVLGELKRLQLAEKTLVFFTSDNGGIVKMARIPVTPENVISSNAPLRGQKHGLYEGGHRVPAIAWWPGTIEPGVSAETTMTMDLMPTLLELAGIERPDDEEVPTLDGISMASLLRKGEPLPERALFWRQGDSRAVRRGDWKLVSIHRQPFELYDLSDDIAERKELSETKPTVRSQLLEALATWESQFNE